MDAAEIPSVKGLLVLDGDGKRIVARYFSSHFASATDELAFEKKLFDKTARTNAKTEGAMVLMLRPSAWFGAARSLTLFCARPPLQPSVASHCSPHRALATRSACLGRAEGHPLK